MKTHANQQSNSNAGRSAGKNQASANHILQVYKKEAAQLQSFDEESPIQNKGVIQEQKMFADKTDMIRHTFKNSKIKVTSTARKHKHKRAEIVAFLQGTDHDAAVLGGNRFSIAMPNDEFLGYTTDTEATVIVTHCGPFGKAVTAQL